MACRESRLSARLTWEVGEELMKYSEARTGRAFVIRLEDGDVVHDEIEQLAREKGIQAATVIVIGAADQGSKLVVGPRDKVTTPIEPMERVLRDVHEVAGVGTLFPNEEGEPVVHLHIACGRGSSTVTGCIRRGVKTWQVMELILLELVGSTARRQLSDGLGFQLLQP